jgi:hypothetical protein
MQISDRSGIAFSLTDKLRQFGDVLGDTFDAMANALNMWPFIPAWLSLLAPC